MKTEIPDALKHDLPQTPWGKLIAATPVFMAVVATLLAGLASSEMTRAQYCRALAAQQQSKAGDQWGLYQAKRMRGSIAAGDADMLHAMAVVHPFKEDALRAAITGVNAPAAGADASAAAPAGDDGKIVAELDSPAGAAAASMLKKGAVPKPTLTKISDPIQAVIDAVAADKDEDSILTLVAPLKDADVDAMLAAAKGDADAFDAANKPTFSAIDQLNDQVSTISTPDGDVGIAITAARRDLSAARMKLYSSRYDAEARLNMAIANGYEVQVRMSNEVAERHHKRSRFFFFGMLAAQLGVVVSTLAMAARQRSLLWGIAAASGLAAVISAAIIFVTV